MKVKDLIAELSKCDPEALVITDNEWCYLEVVSIRTGSCRKRDECQMQCYGFEAGINRSVNGWKSAVCIEEGV